MTDNRNTQNKVSPSARRKARRFAMQALYQWQISSNNLTRIEAEFMVDNDMVKVDTEYFKDVLHGVPRELSKLDEAITPYLDRNISDLTPIELTILRIGVYEFIHRIDVPYKVVINEGVELSKKFGASEGHKYVNGLLDKLAQKLRLEEVRGF